MEHFGVKIMDFLRENIDWLLSGIIPSSIIYLLQRRKKTQLTKESEKLKEKYAFQQQLNNQFSQNMNNLYLTVGSSEIEDVLSKIGTQQNQKKTEEQLDVFQSLTDEIERQIKANAHSKSYAWLIDNENKLVNIGKKYMKNDIHIWEYKKRKSFIKQLLLHLKMASGLVKMNSGLPKDYGLPTDIYSSGRHLFIKAYSQILKEITKEKELDKDEKKILLDIFKGYVDFYKEQ